MTAKFSTVTFRTAKSGTATTEVDAARHTPRPTARQRPRRRPAAAAIWLGPALLTLLITSFQAGQAELWRDELATWSAATRSLRDLLRLLDSIDAV